MLAWPLGIGFLDTLHFWSGGTLPGFHYADVAPWAGVAWSWAWRFISAPSRNWQTVGGRGGIENLTLMVQQMGTPSRGNPFHSCQRWSRSCNLKGEVGWVGKDNPSWGAQPGRRDGVLNQRGGEQETPCLSTGLDIRQDMGDVAGKTSHWLDVITHLRW